MGSNAPTDLWALTATEILPQLQKGDIKVVDYAQALIKRVQERDPLIKGWAYFNSDHILSQAKHLDSIPPEQRKPLHGLPIGVKDVILTKDMPTQFNSRLFEGDKASTGVDANCIMSLRALGALVMGKTATTEFAATKQGNWHQNLCRNPRDEKRTPGGSSSGSGAVVADQQVPIALGTQTAGSVVRPASFNGVYALKPTWGAISREGLAQYSMTTDTLGIFARSTADLDLLASAFRLADDEPIPSTPFNLKDAKIGMCKTHHWSKAGPGTQAAMEKAATLLTSHGANVSEVNLPDDFDGITQWHNDILAGEGRSSFLGQYLMDSNPDPTMLHETITSHVSNNPHLSRRKQLEAYDNVARLRPVFDAIAAEYDVILTPSVVDEAPVGLDITGDPSFCMMWTVLGTPAMNLIGFQGENGLPVGITAVSGRYKDQHLLYAAKAIGKLFEDEGARK